jgi:hypothetical protein
MVKQEAKAKAGRQVLKSGDEQEVMSERENCTSTHFRFSVRLNPESQKE